MCVCVSVLYITHLPLCLLNKILRSSKCYLALRHQLFRLSHLTKKKTLKKSVPYHISDFTYYRTSLYTERTLEN